MARESKTLRALGDLAGARKLHEQNLEIYKLSIESLRHFEDEES